MTCCKLIVCLYYSYFTYLKKTKTLNLLNKYFALFNYFTILTSFYYSLNFVNGVICITLTKKIITRVVIIIE